MKDLMKTLATVALAFAISTTCSAQEQEAKLDNQWLVKYNTNASKKLDGPYSLQNSDKAIIRGALSDGQRKGNWFAFTKDGGVFARYNYDTNQLLEMDQEEITKALIDVKAPDKEIASNARISFPLMSIDYLTDYMKEQIKKTVPSQYRTQDQIIPAEITVKIDKQGEARYQATYIVNNKEYMPKLKVDEKLLEIDWIPAEFKGEKYDSEYKIYTELRFEDAPDHRRVIWN